MKKRVKSKNGNTNPRIHTNTTNGRTRLNSKINHKYVFVIGGVMSGVGKGIVTSSVGTLLVGKNFGVNLVKVDPYLNVDAGTMNPTEHGEVFVLNSGLETDQDMGNYERFLGRDLTADDYITSGMVYKYVIEKERSLGYGGKFVDADHIREEIVRRIEHSAKVNKSDITIVEIGGTVGDYQNVMFIEAARVLKIRHPHDVLFILVSYLPVPGTIGEMKSKPTQNAVKQLNSYGVQADFIIARGPTAIDQKRKDKIAFTCNVLPEHVIAAPDIKSIYDVPVNFENDHLGDLVLKALNLPARKTDPSFAVWRKIAKGIKNSHEHVVKIGIVGKYFTTGDFILSDAYISVLEAIKFSAYENNVKAEIHTVNAYDFENEGDPNKVIDYSTLDGFDGIVVPGGFGSKGIEGKLNVIWYAREHNIPYFGLCYGMQLMTIEFARNVVGLEGAHTSEIDPKTPYPVIDIMKDQKKKLEVNNYGGSMRLGIYPAKLVKGTIANEAYYNGKLKMENGKFKTEAQNSKQILNPKSKFLNPISIPAQTIQERHRHRYEVNPKYIKQIEKGGLIFSGKSPDGRLMEIVELPREKHPFFLGTQFHPEFLARPRNPHPLFTEFVKATKGRARNSNVKVQISNQAQISNIKKFG